MAGFLSLIESSYMFIAVFGGTVFLILFILTLIGLDHDADGSGFEIVAHDVHDVQGLSFLSVKSVVAFFTFYGLGGLCFRQYGWGGFLLALVSGAVMMAIVSAVLAFVVKMQHSGNVTPQDVVGKEGTVYLSLPEKRGPGGIVTVTLEGGTMEISAVSDEALATGTRVVVTEALGRGSFAVKKQF